VIESYVILAGRIRSELIELERLVSRAERAMEGARRLPQDMDFYVDSAALNLHDVYAGLERLFRQIASTVDGDVPASPDWHRDLLQQMGLDLPKLRPPVLSVDAIHALDEYLRFRHVVRNVYSFQLDSGRIGRLVSLLRPAFERAKDELLAFAGFLERIGMT
jgi:hypothetical protein